MTRLALGVAALVAGLSGCASPARYVEQNADSGIVAIPANTNAWPTYNRDAATALIQKHVGSNYEIVDQREVVTGQQTVNNQQVNQDQAFGTTTTQPIKEWQIAYRKKAGMPTGVGAMPGMPGGSVGGMPLGMPGATQQTQYRQPAVGAAGVHAAGGLVPSAGPGGGVYNAGGFRP